MRDKSLLETISKMYSVDLSLLCKSEHYRKMYLFMYATGLRDIPKCTCGRPLTFRSGGFSTKCKVCAQRETFLQKYGVSNPLLSPEVRAKTKQTMLEKYGVENPSRSKEVMEKKRETFLRKYGVENPSQLSFVKEKKSETSRLHYGVHHPMCSEVVRRKLRDIVLEKYNVDYESVLNKARATNLQKYGTPFPIQNPAVVELRKHNNLRKYGVTNPVLLPEVREKIRQANLEKYGVENPSGHPLVLTRRRETYMKNYGVDHYSKTPERNFRRIVSALEEHDKFLLLSDLDFYSSTKQLRLRCKNCDWEFLVYNTSLALCPKCEKPYTSGERELWSFLSEELRLKDVRTHVRDVLSPFEVDFYLPEYNLAIEYDGLYWHSDIYVDPYYHMRKQDLAMERGVRLLQIFEDEWTEKKDIVKDIIRYNLGRVLERVYARKCEVVLLDASTAREFLERYHLKGFVPARYYLGLVLAADLLMVVSISRHRYSTQNLYELVRIATKSGYVVVGGLSKLLEHFTRVVSDSAPFLNYVDRRMFVGKSCTALRWRVSHKTPPNYYYVPVDPSQVKKYGWRRHSRIKFQKHKLKELFADHFNDSATEREIMSAVGFVRVYDSGNLVCTNF